MMEAMLDSPPTIETRARRARALLFRSRIARRVFGLFVLSALVPLALCAAMLSREFAAELGRAEHQNLDGVVRTFRTTLLGRLGSADDVLNVILMQPGTTDQAAQDNISKLVWVRSVRRVQPTQPWRGAEQFLPVPDARQRRALNAG